MVAKRFPVERMVWLWLALARMLEDGRILEGWLPVAKMVAWC